MTPVQDNAVPQSLLATMNPTAGPKSLGISATEDRFMKLLVAQMKNQDPLNPLDNAEITSQLAQLSTVTGIDKLNTTLEAMMSGAQSNQSLQAAGMIGHGVLAPGSSIQLSDAQAVFGIELSAPADNATVTIRDSSGRPVHQIALGPLAAGTVPLQWDGMTDAGVRAANGIYAFDANATAAGQKVAATALGFGQVTSVSGGAQGVKLSVPGLGELSVADIRKIL
jgi:flagellar basal-body rod modification protein FlgD